MEKSQASNEEVTNGTVIQQIAAWQGKRKLVMSINISFHLHSQERNKRYVWTYMANHQYEHVVIQERNGQFISWQVRGGAINDVIQGIVTESMMPATQLAMGLPQRLAYPLNEGAQQVQKHLSG